MKSPESVKVYQESFLPASKPEEGKDKRPGRVRYFHRGDYLEVEGYGICYLSDDNLAVVNIGKKGHPRYKPLDPFSVYYDSKIDDLSSGWSIHASVRPHLRPVKKY